MLGLRFVLETQIDLWVGPVEQFACDLNLPVCHESELRPALAKLAPRGTQLHLACQVTQANHLPQQARPLVSALVAWIHHDQRQLRRVTWVLPSLADHATWSVVLAETLAEGGPYGR